MSKYEPLQRWLRGQKGSRIAITFAEIETIIGCPLPPSKANRAWWSNNPSNNVMTKEWLAAGYETEQVDIGSEKLVFRKIGSSRPAMPTSGPQRERPGLAERAQEDFESETKPMDDIKAKAVLGTQMLEEFYAEMGGLVKFAPGFDPADPWGEEDWPDPELPGERVEKEHSKDESR